MGFKALTVNTAVEAAGHIYAEDDAAIFQSMFGGDGVLNIGNCLKSTVISNNKVRISDGVLSVGVFSNTDSLKRSPPCTIR